jgi:hypothetical protein
MRPQIHASISSAVLRFIVYHEHVSYYSIAPLAKFFERLVVAVCSDLLPLIDFGSHKQ